MKLCLIGHSFGYELEKLIRIFLPFEKIEICESRDNSDRAAVTVLSCENGVTRLSAELILGENTYTDEKTLENSAENYEKECERLTAAALYNCFVAASGYTPPWGILTGVRPAKLFSRLCKAEGETAAEQYFKNALYVKPAKTELCKKTVAAEKRITDLSGKSSYSLYISIPFCPTRCAYCSFVSHSVEQARRLIPQYIALLCEELRLTAEIAKKLSLKLETIYMGGGTPTSVTAEQLEEIMSAVAENFPVQSVAEYTVEAGRPDTVTKEKLEVIKRMGASRISINPQTMNDEVLKNIGRKHTAAQTEAAFRLARECGFKNINTDLIAGLPGDTPLSFENTLSRVLALCPESVTVHSLSMKRSSTLNTSGLFPEAQMGAAAAEMVEYAEKTLETAGIYPYYMYRQSKTVGNLENVGYAKPGTECLYNVYTMDETHTILACGASAVTKMREPGGNNIERIFNFKYPYEYISRFSELKERKDGILKFYEKYPANNK